jgi:hypothetical protein
MNAPPDAQHVARRWIAKADEDLAAAERLLAIDDSLASVVCFHSQQAVEKLLKALPFPPTPLRAEESCALPSPNGPARPPPLHALPREALLARLDSLTNLRVVRDSASGAWQVDTAPFPGWQDVPTW